MKTLLASLLFLIATSASAETWLFDNGSLGWIASGSNGPCWNVLTTHSYNMECSGSGGYLRIDGYSHFDNGSCTPADYYDSGSWATIDPWVVQETGNHRIGIRYAYISAAETCLGHPSNPLCGSARVYVGDQYVTLDDGYPVGEGTYWVEGLRHFNEDELAFLKIQLDLGAGEGQLRIAVREITIEPASVSTEDMNISTVKAMY